MATMTVSKSRRLVNPGKRKLSPLQKLFFGSKRQRVAVAKKGVGRNHKSQGFIGSVLKNPRASKASQGSRRFRKATGAKKKYYAKSHIARHNKRYGIGRKKNVGSIVTILPAGLNPGRRRKKYRSNRGKKVVIVNKGVKMARKRTRRAKSHRVTIRRRRRNPVYRGKINRKVGVYKYTSNPGRRRRYSRRRRSNPGVTRRHRRYRRNPGMLSGGIATKVLGVIGGVAVTKLLCGFLPSGLQSGVLGYLATAAVAVTQGKLAGKFSKSASLGNDMMVGGLAYLTAKILNDFLPSVGGYTGISGMGLIGGSNFYVPQVPMGNSMGKFLVPGAVQGAIGAGMAASMAGSQGVGRLRRTGRLM